MESIVRNLIPEFKNISGRSLMVYTFESKEKVIYYQLQMLANNSIPGILKADTIGLDGRIYLQYDITSLVPVKKLLERRKMSRNDIITLINQIVNMLEGLEHYLLDVDQIVFDSLYIFADPQDLKLSFAYMPVSGTEQSLDSLKSFLLSLIINDIRFADEPSDNFVQRLIEILKTKDFKVSSLRAYTKDMDTVKPIPAMDTPHPPVNHHTVIEEKENKPPLIKPNNKETKELSKLSYPTKSYIIMGSVIGALILFCLVLVISGVMSPSNPDSLVSLFGFLLIGGAVCYLVYTKVFTSDKKIEKVAPQKAVYVNKAFAVPVIPSIKQGTNPIVKIENQGITPITKTANQDIPPVAKYARQEAAPARSMVQGAPKIPHSDRTIILDSGSIKLPHLKRTQGNNFETIFLKSYPFMLGRLEGQVDYCLNNPAIGKLHAEIKNTPEGFYICDMNSLNGTFVNDERIKSNEDVEIKNGDRITLGNEEFVFICA